MRKTDVTSIIDRNRIIDRELGRALTSAALLSRSWYDADDRAGESRNSQILVRCNVSSNRVNYILFHIIM